MANQGWADGDFKITPEEIKKNMDISIAKYHTYEKKLMQQIKALEYKLTDLSNRVESDYAEEVSKMMDSISKTKHKLRLTELKEAEAEELIKSNEKNTQSLANQKELLKSAVALLNDQKETFHKEQHEEVDKLIKMKYVLDDQKNNQRIREISQDEIESNLNSRETKLDADRKEADRIMIRVKRFKRLVDNLDVEATQQLEDAREESRVADQKMQEANKLMAQATEKMDKAETKITEVKKAEEKNKVTARELNDKETRLMAQEADLKVTNAANQHEKRRLQHLSNRLKKAGLGIK